MVVVIDALDECDREDDATAIIRLLSKAKDVTSVRLRFFVTSRPELPIRLGFKDIGDRYKDLALHEIPKPDIWRGYLYIPELPIGLHLIKVQQDL